MKDKITIFSNSGTKVKKIKLDTNFSKNSKIVIKPSFDLKISSKPFLCFYAINISRIPKISTISNANDNDTQSIVYYQSPYLDLNIKKSTHNHEDNISTIAAACYFIVMHLAREKKSRKLEMNINIHDLSFMLLADVVLVVISV